MSLQKRLEACFTSAATATGCQCEFKYEDEDYDNLITNKVLAELYGKYAKEQGKLIWTTTTKKNFLIFFLFKSTCFFVCICKDDIYVIYFSLTFSYARI